MKTINANVTVNDNCSAQPATLTAISANENISGDVAQAEYGSADRQFLLRAQRDGNGYGNGRVFRVSYTSADSSGNQTNAEAIVEVPHDQGE